MGHDDEDRFRALFDAHASDVLRYATRRVAQPADAADVLVEVFSVAWRRRRQVPPPPQDRLWLFGVARRAVANHRRGERRRSALQDRLRASLDVSFPIDEHPSLDEPGRSVATAMAALDPGDRELLRLSAWEQLTPSGIATVVGVPAATVRVRLHRARARLAARLQRDAPAGHGGPHER